MALDTYAALKASVADWLARTDLTTQIPDFIALAEATINRRLRVREMVTRSTTTSDDQYVSAPSDFAGPISLRATSGNAPALNWIDPAKLEDYAGTWDANAGTPVRYTVLGSSLVFSPTPGESAEYQLIYYARVPALSTGNTTNWLLTKHPDIYLWGALAAAGPYLIEDSRLSMWATLFSQAIADANGSSVSQSAGGQLQLGSPVAP